MSGDPYTADELSAIMRALDDSEEHPQPFTAAEVEALMDLLPADSEEHDRPFTAAEVEALMDVLPAVESEPDLGAMLAAMEESDRRILAGLAEGDDLDLSTLIETVEGE